MNINPSSTEPPLWLRVPQAAQLVGLSRTRLYELISKGRIRSASLRGSGQSKGVRLIDRQSLLDYIESHVERASK